jgi:hypothetical protein
LVNSFNLSETPSGSLVTASGSQSGVHTVTNLQTENYIEFSFTNLQYGLETLPTHVSLIVERIPTDINDTLVGDAFLLGGKITLPRD